jgi:hypothetical protein
MQTANGKEETNKSRKYNELEIKTQSSGKAG